jgi:hypothetical protein
MVDFILKRPESFGETRLTEKGRFEVLRLAGLTVGQATHEHLDQAGLRMNLESTSAEG